MINIIRFKKESVGIGFSYQTGIPGEEKNYHHLELYLFFGILTIVFPWYSREFSKWSKLKVYGLYTCKDGLAGGRVSNRIDGWWGRKTGHLYLPWSLTWVYTTTVDKSGDYYIEDYRIERVIDKYYKTYNNHIRNSYDTIQHVMCYKEDFLNEFTVTSSETGQIVKYYYYVGDYYFRPIIFKWFDIYTVKRSYIDIFNGDSMTSLVGSIKIEDGESVEGIIEEWKKNYIS